MPAARRIASGSIRSWTAARDKAFLETLGSDLAFIETIHKYFAGTMMEARRYFEPLADDDDERDGADDETDTDKEG